MDAPNAVAALSALAHEGRLSIFRDLVRAGPGGLAAGEIGRRLKIAPSTLSASLTVLSHAGLADSRRDGRSIIYRARFDQVGDLLAFLIEDCCGGAPAICQPLIAITERAACCPPAARNAKLQEQDS